MPFVVLRIEYSHQKAIYITISSYYNNTMYVYILYIVVCTADSTL